MSTTVKYEGLKELQDAFRETVSGWGRNIGRGLLRAGSVVAGRAKTIIYRGRPHHLIGDSGRLHQSIIVAATGGDVQVGSNLIYSRVHELGAVITPVRAKMLHFVTREGVEIFARRVVIPARPYLRPAVRDTEKQIVAAVVTEALRPLDKRR
tara:strand:+ start:47 stop:502 length:456 start_codon:yes stop_codon:yes gene_type:complete